MPWVIFDIDGVLIDVSDSYDVAVKRTVEHFLRNRKIDKEISLLSIRKMRKKGIFPDDYKLSEALIIGLKERQFDFLIEDLPKGFDIEYMREHYESERSVSSNEVKELFDRMYFGDDTRDKGLWKKEKALVCPRSLEKLSKNYRLGVITGRSRRELKLAEKILSFEFESSVTRENFVKPDPEAIRTLTDDEDSVYLGDSLVDKKLVENYNERYDEDFEFIWIGQEVEDVEKAVKKILKKKDKK